MRYKEYHYRVNSIKKQIDNLRQINEEQHFIIYNLKSKLDDVTLDCANLRTELVKAQVSLDNLLSSYNRIIMKEVNGDYFDTLKEGLKK